MTIKWLFFSRSMRHIATSLAWCNGKFINDSLWAPGFFVILHSALVTDESVCNESYPFGNCVGGRVGGWWVTAGFKKRKSCSACSEPLKLSCENETRPVNLTITSYPDCTVSQSGRKCARWKTFSNTLRLYNINIDLGKKSWMFLRCESSFLSKNRKKWVIRCDFCLVEFKLNSYILFCYKGAVVRDQLSKNIRATEILSILILSALCLFL